MERFHGTVVVPTKRYSLGAVCSLSFIMTTLMVQQSMAFVGSPLLRLKRLSFSRSSLPSFPSKISASAIVDPQALFSNNIRQTDSVLHLRDTIQDSDGDSGETQYEDDCFGLIFLTGLLVVHDPVFTATFVTLSTAALIATRLGSSSRKSTSRIRSSRQQPLGGSPERQRRLVPAAIAAATLLLYTLVEAVVYTPPDLEENARAIEIAVCSVSILYGLLAPKNKVVDGDKSR